VLDLNLGLANGLISSSPQFSKKIVSVKLSLMLLIYQLVKLALVINFVSALLVGYFILYQGCGSISRIFLLPLPAQYKVSRFRVCFRFQLRIKLVASKFASASSFFLQSASASQKT